MAKQTQYEFQWGLPNPKPTLVPEPSNESMLFEASLPAVPDSDAPAERAGVPPASRCLPVPKPLSDAVGQGHFGEDEHGPIRPTPAEIRAITENHAQKLGDLLLGLEEIDRSLGDSQCSDRARLYHEKDRLLSAYQSGIALYQEDFGVDAASRLDGYVRGVARRR
jgi:hypothetical protein